MTSRQPVSKDESVLIVGAGVFGLATALELKKRGYRDVVVLDRFLPPVVDGSSVDISRIIRFDYADPIYSRMAREALVEWNHEWKGSYYNSGLAMFANQSGNTYLDKTIEVHKANGTNFDQYQDAKDFQSKHQKIPARLEGLQAVYNPNAGWADAESSIRRLSMKCTLAGVSFITGPRGTVQSLRYNGGRVVGVNVAQGEPLYASQVVLATGAWTNRLVPMTHATSASAQPVGFIQLTADEAKELEGMPVMLNFNTGLFCFPPTPETNILKIARHGYGYATQFDVEDDTSRRTVSSPKRDSNNASSGYLPQDADTALREGLRQLLPDFAGHEWMKRRLCWYSDTPSGDFIIDYHPETKGLFFATGGAGQYVEDTTVETSTSRHY